MGSAPAASIVIHHGRVMDDQSWRIAPAATSKAASLAFSPVSISSLISPTPGRRCALRAPLPSLHRDRSLLLSLSLGTLMLAASPFAGPVAAKTASTAAMSMIAVSGAGVQDPLPAWSIETRSTLVRGLEEWLALHADNLPPASVDLIRGQASLPSAQVSSPPASPPPDPRMTFLSLPPSTYGCRSP